MVGGQSGKEVGSRAEVVAGCPSVGGVRARASAGVGRSIDEKKMARDRDLDVLTASHEYSSMPIVNQKGMSLR